MIRANRTIEGYSSSSNSNQIVRNITINQTATIASSLIVDTDTLYVSDPMNRVGIRTQNPTTELEVVGEAKIRNDGSGPKLFFDSSGVDRMILGSYGSKNNVDNKDRSLHVYNNTDSNALVVHSNGNTGFGVLSPTHKVDINGNTQISGDLELPTGGIGIGISAPALDLCFGQVDTGINQGVADEIDFVTNNSVRMNVSNSMIQFNSDTKIRNDGSGPKLTFDKLGVDKIIVGNYNSINNINNKDQKLKIYNDTVADAFVLDTTGNVGIGISIPEETLHVFGPQPNLKIQSGNFLQANIITESNRTSSNIISDISCYNTDTTRVEMTRIRSEKTANEDGNGELSFWTANGTTTTKAMTIDNSGNVIIVGNVTASNLTTSNTTMHIRDEKTNGTDAGTFTNSGWRVRDLNTTYGSSSFATIGSNQITFTQNGVYRIKARAPAYGVSKHKIQLYNSTTSSQMLSSSNAYSVINCGSTDSIIDSIFTITGTPTIELRHYCSVSRSTDGKGINCSFGGSYPEVYSEVWITRISD